MKEWKIRSKIYHSIFKVYDDDLEKEIIVEELDKESIVMRALEYPVKQTKELYYPAKSYAVGITFAHLLEKEFNEDFYESLSDPNLLYENDPYFKPYSNETAEIYDSIIKDFPFELTESIGLGCLNYTLTKTYFYKEMLLHEDTKQFFSSNK